MLVDHVGYQGLDPWNVSFIQTNRKDPKDPGFREYYEDGPDGLDASTGKAELLSAHMSAGRSCASRRTERVPCWRINMKGSRFPVRMT